MSNRDDLSADEIIEYTEACALIARNGAEIHPDSKELRHHAKMVNAVVTALRELAQAKERISKLERKLKNYEPINLYNGLTIEQWKARAEAAKRRASQPEGSPAQPSIESQAQAESEAARTPAPPNSLPTWQECQLRVNNSDSVAKSLARGGYGADYDVLLATELHRFIYEYDDADRYRSAWFLHRLELLLNETRQLTKHTTSPQSEPTKEEKSGTPEEERRLALGAARLEVVGASAPQSEPSQ